ncbi:AAA family ATPase [Halomonas aquamarina]|uniref:AAA family ATPase n=1 Tax=Vreelandella aquamarina TaxID=77097 RepID=A0ACC5VPM1_9GAMM|nr:AAA family ATPase [Halomonas aquamarina]MBZ5486185.1 AAA family ATPase [Halomonas aquamarina]
MKIAPVISFINMKGGVGKTTLCVGIGEFLSNYLNKKVLVIDIDPQFNATQSLLNKYEKVDEYLNSWQREKKTIRRIFETPASILESAKPVPEVDVITELSDKLHIILGDINIIFDNSQEAVRILKLKKFINENNIPNKYDYILIDSPPTISLFTDAALIASDYYLVPVKIDHYSVLGATSLLRVVNNLKYNHSSDIAHLGFIYTNTDEQLTAKTGRIKEQFESTVPFNQLYFFESKLTRVRDLTVGVQGNIPSSYQKSRSDIEKICEEFMAKVEELSGGEDE